MTSRQPRWTDDYYEPYRPAPAPHRFHPSGSMFLAPPPALPPEPREPIPLYQRPWHIRRPHPNGDPT